LSISKPKRDWRAVFDQNKEELISAMDRELVKIPGAVWNFSQPISDNVEEAVSGVKGELAVKLYGTDLKLLEQKGDQIVQVMSSVRGVADLGLFRVIGQPNLNYTVDRTAAARFGINVADIQDAIESAVGGSAVTKVLDGEASYDVTVRYSPQFRATPEAISNIRLVAPSGERVSISQLTKLQVTDGAESIGRENGVRYVAIKYSVRNRDLGTTVQEAIDKVNKQVSLPPGYRLDWAGEYESQKRSSRRLAIVCPITILIIFMILYGMFNSFKWALLVLANVAIAPVGGLVALYLTGNHFSVSSGVGFLALFGVSVQTGIIMLECINQMRARGLPIDEAALEGAVLRLRPIMMTMIVATVGLLPAALSHGIGSDSQRPFAIVIVGGLIGALLIGVSSFPPSTSGSHAPAMSSQPQPRSSKIDPSRSHPVLLRAFFGRDPPSRPVCAAVSRPGACRRSTQPHSPGQTWPILPRARKSVDPRHQDPDIHLPDSTSRTCARTTRPPRNLGISLPASWPAGTDGRRRLHTLART